MPEQPDPKIKELEDRLDALVRTQINFQTEITAIRRELVRLNASRIMAPPPARGDKEALYTRLERTGPPVGEPTTRTAAVEPLNEPTKASVASSQPTVSDTPPKQPPPPPAASTAPPSGAPTYRPPVRETSYELPKRTPYVPDPVLSSATTSGDAFSRFVSQYTDKARENLEEFVGKNLISLIGIVVLILGVGIGAKYAIDNNWISPLTRIIIGYIFGFGLVGLAIKLRKNYLNFSAVLFSGGMAIMYFVTYFAYSAYGLIGQLPAFGLMIMFTVCTVAGALVYSRQVVAHIGLVGAYAVPFLLSNDSGNYLALFIYMAVINTGILAISVKKDWKPIFYTSSLFTWAIFCGWYATKYSEEHFYLALIFLAVFFVTFYIVKLAQARKLGDADPTENTVSTVLTTAVFYVMCYAITVSTPHEGLRYWALFTYLGAASALIVITSLRFHREPFTFYAAWFATWGVFVGWFATRYSSIEHLDLALVFLGVYFVLFYGTALVQRKLTSADPEVDATPNIAIALLTGVVFYAMCFAILLNASHETSVYWRFLTYVAVASAVMLATSFKFYGRLFMYLVVPFTWTLYGSWFAMHYDPEQHFQLAAVFAALYFALFYFSILFHRLVENNFSVVEHTSLILGNAFVAAGFGYSLIDGNPTINRYLGLYMVANALLHLVVALVVRSVSKTAIDVVQVLTVLVLTFASIAVPVQFDGNIVTMVWAAEAAVLFGYGRLRGVGLFEKFSYPVMLLATGSMFLDWAVTASQRGSGEGGALTPFANSDFITAIVYVFAFAFIYVVNRERRHEPAVGSTFVRRFGLVVGAVGTLALYNMFRTEIDNYFYLATVNAAPEGSASPGRPLNDLLFFDIAWQINYTLFFLGVMAVVNLRKFRSSLLALVNWVLAVIALAAFSTLSMYFFAALRNTFIFGAFNPDVISHWMYIAIRPISYLIAGGLLYLMYEYSRDSLMEERVEKDVLTHAFAAMAYLVVFIVASCELVNLMEQFPLPDATKLGLSILWGVYALLMIVVGIAKDKKYVRIAAMVLLGITLAKLFFYDIAELETIQKTILFVTLGITLLVISFLYNKYKGVIFKTGAAQED